MCKSLLVMLRQLAEKAGNDALIDPDGVKYVEDDFDFSHLDATWPLAMSKFDTPAGQRVIEDLAMGRNPNEKDIKEIQNGSNA